VAKSSNGHASTPITLVRFGGTNGAFPFGALMSDAIGNLFGTTSTGGAAFERGINGGYGTVFEVAKTSSGDASTPITLVSFRG
jgi:hypothetical protein